jgi:hypothetical protein
MFTTYMRNKYLQDKQIIGGKFKIVLKDGGRGVGALKMG